MATGEDSADWPDRFKYVKMILERTSPLAHPDFTPGKEQLEFIRKDCRLLVIGAGGLGCELLKDLALLGFVHIDVIDMDTVDLSNLNRQFLFRKSDIGKPKAQVAADFINNRIAGCKVTPHVGKIQDYDQSFYQSFNIVVCGLDSIVARRWINAMLVSLLQYDDEGELDTSTIVPMVDGGTEGFKGNARVILPGITACVECTLDLYPPQVNFPLCTIAHTPRLPEHCVEYVRLLLWPKEIPFGKEQATIDGDNPEHVSWIFHKAKERAEEYKISGVTYRLTQGVVKRIIPAVASTNAVIAAVCATEVFKIATNCFPYLNNYMNFNDVEGIYTTTLELERKDNCPVCCQVPQSLRFCETDKLQDIVTYLKENPAYQFKSPGITTSVDGRNRTLYISTVPSIEVTTRPNLKKSLKELELHDGQHLVVADETRPTSITFQLHLTTAMEN